MYHRTYAVQIDAGVCRRLARLRRRTGTPVQKLVNSILRRYADELAPAGRLARAAAPARSWRRR
jgi:hypothetical protein